MRSISAPIMTGSPGMPRKVASTTIAPSGSSRMAIGVAEPLGGPFLDACRPSARRCRDEDILTLRGRRRRRSSARSRRRCRECRAGTRARRYRHRARSRKREFRSPRRRICSVTSSIRSIFGERLAETDRDARHAAVANDHVGAEAERHDRRVGIERWRKSTRSSRSAGSNNNSAAPPDLNQTSGAKRRVGLQLAADAVRGRSVSAGVALTSPPSPWRSRRPGRRPIW